MNQTSNAIIITYKQSEVIDRQPIRLDRATWESVQAGADIYALDGLPTLGSNQSVSLIGDEFCE